MTTTRGQHLIGKEIGSCILERLLGYGGSSAVFLARSLTAEEQVAVKVFLPRSTLDGQMRKSFYQRFLREAEAASQLDHPHILSVYAYGEHEGMPYIVMPYMAGGTLSERIQHEGPLSLQEALSHLEQIAAALDYAHEHHCVHCDVKPANILLDATGNAALSDFGIVHLLQADEKPGAPAKNARKENSETLMGTPDYVSPEQALGEKLDGRSDIYSLAATLYALLTGEPPFQADTPIALALMHVHETPTPLGLLRADVTPQIDMVMAKALAKWPEERYQTAGSFAAAFKQAVKEADEHAPFKMGNGRRLSDENASVLANMPAVAAPSVQIKPIARSRFHPWRTSLLVGLVIVLLLACLTTALFIRTLNDSRQPNTSMRPTLTQQIGPADLLALDAENWPKSATFFFQSNAYAIQNTSSLGNPAMAFYQNHHYGDFRLQVTTRELQGSFDGGDYYGLAFRAPLDQSHYYLFDVTAWNHGQYDFLRYDGEGHWSTLKDGPLTGFQNGAGVTNTLSVEARGDAFTLFLNGRQIGKPISDHTKKALTSGEIGLMVEERGTTIAFSHLYITTF
ncbi:MAG TPA: protein kinase [Ktedonobacteraceae bacterium]